MFPLLLYTLLVYISLFGLPGNIMIENTIEATCFYVNLFPYHDFCRFRSVTPSRDIFVGITGPRIQIRNKCGYVSAPSVLHRVLFSSFPPISDMRALCDAAASQSAWLDAATETNRIYRPDIFIRHSPRFESRNPNQLSSSKVIF
jgi:hypothetical protein